MGFSTGKKLLVTKRNMRSGSGALSTWGTNLAAMYYIHSSLRKVHQAKSHVVCVYWIDTVYVQNNLPSEFSEKTIFIR